MAYLKIDHEILESSTWWDLEAAERCVWITLLVQANKNADCTLRGNIKSVAALARVTEAECEAAIQKLSSADPQSKSQVDEGRRIVSIQGGWRVVNLQYYRDKRSNNPWAILKAEQRKKN